jgi:hypothetical protein
MDPTFYEHLKHELRRLLENEEAGVQPRNPELSQAVYAVLRKQQQTG